VIDRLRRAFTPGRQASTEAAATRASAASAVRLSKDADEMGSRSVRVLAEMAALQDLIRLQVEPPAKRRVR
jgi:hypothetical protein